MNLLVVIGSVRKGRVGDKVANWFVEQVKQDGSFDVDLVDLKELGLSYELPETHPSMVKDGQYEYEVTRKWATHVKDADAVVFVSPEYNHGLPASVKNAVDSIFAEWNDKPVAFVGYGASGAPYANAAFTLSAAWVKMNFIGTRVGISEIWAAFNEDGTLNFADKYDHDAQAVIKALASKAAK